jgi:hypothetical protein
MTGRKRSFGSPAERKAAMANLRRAPTAPPRKAPLPGSRRLPDLEYRLEPLFEHRLDRDAARQACEASHEILSKTAPRRLRDEPQDLAIQLFNRLRKLGGVRRDPVDYLILASEAVRLACIEDRAELLTELERHADQQAFPSLEARVGYLQGLRSLKARIDAGFSLDGAVHDTRKRWEHERGVSQSFLEGAERAYLNALKAYRGER